MRFEIEYPTELDDCHYLKMYDDDDDLIGSLSYEFMTDYVELIFDDSEEVSEYVSNNFDSIIYLSRLNIQPEYRGEGFGNILMKYFVDNLMTEPTILYKSAFAVQDYELYNKIILPKFYNKFGFEKLFDTDYYLNTKI